MVVIIVGRVGWGVDWSWGDRVGEGVVFVIVFKRGENGVNCVCSVVDCDSGDSDGCVYIDSWVGW